MGPLLFTRYFVVETGSWLSSRKVLISPISIHHPDWAKKLLPISITKQQVKDSPKINTQKPVSRQHEIQHLRYYGYPYYWGGVGLWCSGMNPYAMSPGHVVAPTNHIEPKTFSSEIVARERGLHRGENSNLRSCEAVVGYSIHAIDGEVGHAAGPLVDKETWAIRYIVIDTSDWWISHQVLIAPQWITDVNWADQSITVHLTRESVKTAPDFDSTRELNRERETGLYHHDKRHGYWMDTLVLEREI